MYRIEIFAFGVAFPSGGPNSVEIRIRPSSLASVNDSKKFSTCRKAEMF